MPFESTCEPQIHKCGEQTVTPKRNATAIRIDASSRRVPIDDIGMAFRKAPDDCADAANNRARLSLSGAASNTRREANNCNGFVQHRCSEVCKTTDEDKPVITCHSLMYWVKNSSYNPDEHATESGNS